MIVLPVREHRLHTAASRRKAPVFASSADARSARVDPLNPTARARQSSQKRWPPQWDRNARSFSASVIGWPWTVTRFEVQPFPAAGKPGPRLRAPHCPILSKVM